jgi:ABC-type phosphate/phosphonate transport system substrate-binding protein
MADNLNRREALAVAAVGLTVLSDVTEAAEKVPENAFTLVVNDPLAAPLACACVKGYAQRDYDRLGKYLEAKLGRPVAVVHAASLARALRKSDGKADLVIGKDSVVRAEAAAAEIGVAPVAALTGLDGKTTHRGLVMVPTADPALTVGDLKGYTVFFGPPEADEKHAAALELFTDLNVPVPPKDKLDTCTSDSDAAVNCLDRAKKGEKAAAVVASSGEPLLEACGTIKRGDLKVVGETDDVPFIVAFVSDKLGTADRAAVEAALADVAKAPELCKAIETKAGFTKIETPAAQKK